MFAFIRQQWVSELYELLLSDVVVCGGTEFHSRGNKRAILLDSSKENFVVLKGELISVYLEECKYLFVV